MKHIYLICCFLTVAILSSAEEETSVTIKAWQATKQAYSEPIHYVGLGAKVGYSQFNMKNDYLKIPGGANAGLEFRYKLEKKAFRFTAGLDFTYAGNSFKGDYEKGGLLGEPVENEMTYYYKFRNIKEQENVLEVGVPIMFGANFKGFYAQAGMRLGIPVVATYKMQTDMTPYIADKRAIDVYTQMPNHFLTNGSNNDATKLKLSTINPQIALEIGMSLDPWMQKKIEDTGKMTKKGYKPAFAELLHYEIALYANIGVMEYNATSSGDKTDLCQIIPGEEPIDYSTKPVKSVTSYNEFASNKMIPWNIGVRFNVYYEIFDAPRKEQKKRLSHRERPDVVFEEPKVEVEEPPVETKDTFILENLYFDNDKSTIRRVSLSAIDKLAEMLNTHPNMKITLVGHTDNTASRAYNQRLSLARVNSVKAELIKRGIGGDRIRTVGKGMTEPIADNNTAEGRAKNRRVEVIIDQK